MKKLVLTILLLLVGEIGWAAVAVDSTSSGSAFDTISITVSHTVSGSDRFLVVGTQIDESGTTVSGVTYNGVALTSIGAISNSPNVRVELWGLIAPATGTNNIVVTYAATANVWKIVQAVSFTGVHQTTPSGTAVTGQDVTATSSIDVSSASDELVVDAVGVSAGPALTVGTGQTQRLNLDLATDLGGGMSTEPGAGTVTMSWTWTGAEAWAAVGVSIKPSGAAAAPSLPVILSSRRRH